MSSIVIRQLTKSYDKNNTLALDSLSLQVQPGEVYGFLGANGAGKSTAIRLLLNFIQPSSGTAHIMGKDIVEDTLEVKKHVGYLAGDVALWPWATGGEIFDYLLRLQSHPRHNYLSKLIKRFEAEPDKPIDTLSKGNRQKIGIIQALMHEPDVLILDEPTSGLDPLMQEVFYAEIRRAAARGAAVFVSSHNLAEVQHICNRVGIIKHGRLIREQSIGSDDKTIGQTTFLVVLQKDKDIKRLIDDKHLRIISHRDNTATVQPSSSLAEALKALSTYDLASLTTKQSDLEDEFLEYYGENS